jgi:tetratricopeptide (TPR) repeat protein
MLLAAVRRRDEAEEEFRRVLKLVPDSERWPGPRWQHARAAHNLGVLLVERSEAREQGLEKIRTAQSLLEGLRQEFPDVPQYREELAVVSTNLGMSERWATGEAQALHDLRRGAEVSEQLVQEFPTVPRYRVRYADACRHLAGSLAQTDPAHAEELARKSIELLTELAPSRSELPTYLGASLGRAYSDLGRILVREKRVDAARAAVEQALGYDRAVLNSSPESPNYRQSLWDDHRNLSFIRLELRDVAGAAEEAEELLRLRPDTNSYFYAVVLLVRCAERSPDQRVHFHDRAMDLLGRAVNRWKLSRKLLDHPGLKALRDRDDFGLMMMDLAFPVDPFTR